MVRGDVSTTANMRIWGCAERCDISHFQWLEMRLRHCYIIMS